MQGHLKEEDKQLKREIHKKNAKPFLLIMFELIE